MATNTLLLCSLLVGLCTGLPQQTENKINLDDLIKDVFDTGNQEPTIPDGTGGPFNPNPVNPEPFNPGPVNPGPVNPVNPDPVNVPRQPNVNTIGCGAGSECVPYYLCNNGMINTDGAGVIDIRIDDDTPKECPQLEVCCSHDGKVNEPIIKPKPVPAGCGHRNIDGIGFKISGGRENETEYGEFPWMVAVLKEEKAIDQVLNIYQCGGSLIHPSVVLTAAHCVQNKSPNILKVRAGEWDTQTKAELYPDQDRQVSEVVVHEHFYKGGLFNDIALLFLESPFELADNVKPVCLPPPDMQFDYQRCFATGWGKDKFGQDGKYSVILKKIDLPIVPRDECQDKLRSTRLGKYFQLHDSFVCAGGEIGKDTCRGDGGSPLVCPIPNAGQRYYQTGIVAWGIGCGDSTPGVYVSVAKLRRWIDEMLQYRRIESQYYTP